MSSSRNLAAPGDDADKQLLRILGRMPLASSANLAPLLRRDRIGVRRQLNKLRDAGWLASVRRGMIEPPQDRWFLTRRAVQSLYVTDHAHRSTLEIARVGGHERFRALHASRGSPVEPIGLDHEHFPHLEEPMLTPFAPSDPSESAIRALGHELHEHPPWTATSRGLRSCMRRLATLEAIYPMVSELPARGRLKPPGADGDGDTHASSRPQLQATDFRLLRHGGFHHALARYGDDLWVAFTFAGLHATERVLRRKQMHRYWGIDCYVAAADDYLRIADRRFYEDPEERVEPSALVVVAADDFAAELARRTLVTTTPTLVCTSDGHCSEPVELRRSFDVVADPLGHTPIGTPESRTRWNKRSLDLLAIDGPTAFKTFMAIAEFPSMTSALLCELVGRSERTVKRVLARFSEVGLIEVFDGRCYLAEKGMRRAASLSRVLPAVISNRQAAYLTAEHREHQVRHDDGVNQLVVQFARQGIAAYGGWRGELNLRNMTQVKPRPGPACLAWTLRLGHPLHRVRALRDLACRCVAQAAALPPIRGCRTSRPAADRVRDRTRSPQLHRGQRRTARSSHPPRRSSRRPAVRRRDSLVDGPRHSVVALPLSSTFESWRIAAEQHV